MNSIVNTASIVFTGRFHAPEFDVDRLPREVGRDQFTQDECGVDTNFGQMVGG